MNNWKSLSLLLVAMVIGCGEVEQAEQSNVETPKALVPGVDIPLNPQGDIRPKQKPKPRLNLEPEAPPQRLVNTAGVIQPEVTKLLEQIDQSRLEGPTVVAWIMDRSKSASNMVDGVRLQVQYSCLLQTFSRLFLSLLHFHSSRQLVCRCRLLTTL